MLRVRSTALTRDEDGLSHFAGEPFSGLAYRVDDDGVVCRLDVFDRGRSTGTSDDWFELSDSGVRVELSRLEMVGDYGPYHWRSAPITGVVYTFDPHGPCLVEEVYRDGLPRDDARRAWYPSGALHQMSRGDEGSAWFEDGGLQSKGIGDTTLLNLIVRDGRLGAIVLWDASLLDIATIERIGFSDELLLIGPGIDAGLLAMLRERAALANVPRLRLIETSAGPEAVDLLETLEGLRVLWLTNNPALQPGDAERVRALRPECTVHFEQREADT